MSGSWTLVVATAVGCYVLKLAGYVVPARVLDQPRIRQLVTMLPVALLAALIVVQALADGKHLDLDGARLTGIAAGAVAVWRRAPFLAVVIVAGATAALLRLA
ncbi:MAG: branched-chain amino acid transport [Pseudonocardiales bacterium]|nr:branched-chain amino acid transport [Pseudonocardiales bacterium]